MSIIEYYFFKSDSKKLKKHFAKHISLSLPKVFFLFVVSVFTELLITLIPVFTLSYRTKTRFFLLLKFIIERSIKKIVIWEDDDERVHILPKIKKALSHKRKRFMNIWTQCQFDFIHVYERRRTLTNSLEDWVSETWKLTFMVLIFGKKMRMVGGEFTEYMQLTHPIDQSIF